MANAASSFINPNYTHGCHPQSRQGYFETLDLTLPPKPIPSTLSPVNCSDSFRTDACRITLQNVFRRVHRCAYPGKSQLIEWILYKYRRGCKPVTLATHCSYIVAFLVFLGQTGKTVAQSNGSGR